MELPPYWIEQNALTASAFAGLKKLSISLGTSALTSTAVMEQIPLTSGRDLKERFRKSRRRFFSKMDPVITDRCVKIGPE